MIVHINTAVLATGLVIPSGNKNYTSSGIDPVMKFPLTELSIHATIIFIKFSLSSCF